jgi:acyl-CoA synthetase (AMP-forming)/AMP-acid ligase II
MATVAPLHGARTIWELVDRRAAATPDRTILLDEHGRTLTCAELRDAVEGCAAGLFARGIRAGTTVSWQLPTRFETIVLSSALARLGAVQNPIIPIYGAREVRAMLDQAASEWFVVPGVWRGVDYAALATQCCGETTHGCMPLVVDARLGEPGFPTGDPAMLPDPPAADDPSTDEVRWIYTTSGTTSLPKGVMHTDGSLLAGGGGLGAAFEVTPDDVALFAVPWAHIAGPDWLVLMTMYGLPTVVMEAFVPQDAVALMRTHGVTMTGGATALYQALLSLQRAQPDEPLVPTLRILMGGGGPKPPELFYEVQREMFGVRITHGYGMTESPMIANGSPSDTDEQLAHTDGRPVPGCEVRIVRDDGTPAAADEEGGIHIRGPMLFRGYLDPAQTAEVVDADGWFDTGDRGVLRADGHLAVTGRTKDVIIRKGENIGAVEVESVVYEHPSVGAVAVIGLPDAERGERVCAVVELVDGAPALTLRELQEHCRAAGLSRRKWPEQLEIVDALPRNPTMKILKYRLKEQFS